MIAWGHLSKAKKVISTYFLQSRYKEAIPSVFLSSLPWQPKCCMLEGMFLINTTPLGSHVVMSDYAKFLFMRFVMPQFRRGCNEVHVIFDNPGRLNNTPKYFEHKCRYQSVMIHNDHYCDSISSTTTIPKKWRENLLNCRKCKRSLVKYLTHFFLHYMHKHLIKNQTIYLAGGYDDAISDTCCYMSYNNKPQPDSKFSSNSEETDTRIWLHILKSDCTRILVISPDTDVYHIGLPLVTNSSKDITVQVSAINSKEIRFVNLSALAYALVNDPDLAALELSDLPQILQTLFVCTGCDTYFL